MKRIYFLLFFTWFFTTGTTYYVSNRTDLGGAGNSGDPFSASEIWANASPGDVFLLQDGTYQGANAMLNAETGGGEGVNGTSIAFIIIRAENDGAVLFDGQQARAPCVLSDNDFFKIEGIDCANPHGGADASFEVDSNSNFVELRRIVAYDSFPTTDDSHFNLNGSTNVLCEDCAAFGDGRKSFVFLGSGTGTSGGYEQGGVTCRRCFAHWTFNDAIGPKIAYSTSYTSLNMIHENVISVWDSSMNPVNQPYGPIAMDLTVNIKNYVFIYGSIGMILQNTSSDPIAGWFITRMNEVHIQDSVSYIEAGTAYTGVRVVNLASTSDSSVNLTITDFSSIHNGNANLINAQWSQTNVVQSSTVAGLLNTIYEDATGAAVCLRYEEGILTSEPLWPWPMDSRIRAAMTAAGESPDTILGGTDNGVTEFIEGHFGTIPDGCRSTTTPPAVETQTYARFRLLVGDETSSGAPWAAAEDANTTISPGGARRIRLKVAATTNDPTEFNAVLFVDDSTDSPGTYIAVPDACTSSNLCFYGEATSIEVADEVITTEQLTSDHANNVDCGVKLQAIMPFALALGTNTEAECEFAIKIGSSVAVGTTYDFRLYKEGGTALAAYTVTPRLTVQNQSAGGGF